MDIEQIIDKYDAGSLPASGDGGGAGKMAGWRGADAGAKENSLQLVMLWQARYNTDAQHMTIDTRGQMVMKSKQQLKEDFGIVPSRSPPLSCNKAPAGGAWFRRRGNPAPDSISVNDRAQRRRSACLLFVHHRFQIGKRVVGGLTDALLRIFARHHRGAILIGFGVLGMFVIVTIQAQHLPVTPIFRVMGVVVIDMVHRQLAQIGVDKLP